MPTLKTYRLFISHSWTYGDAYERLVKFFKEHPNFSWKDYSVPKKIQFIMPKTTQSCMQQSKTKLLQSTAL